MGARSRSLFLVLILTQTSHSLGEYDFQLWEIFAPVRIVSGLVSDDLETGFLLVNTSLVLLGLWGYLARVRPGHASAGGWAWFWVLHKLGNGVGHLVVAWYRGGYLSGALASLQLLCLSIALAVRLVR